MKGGGGGVQLGEKEGQRQRERGERLPLTEAANQEKEQGGLGEGGELGRNQKETRRTARRMSVSFWRMRMRLISLQR